MSTLRHPVSGLDTEEVWESSATSPAVAAEPCPRPSTGLHLSVDHRYPGGSCGDGAHELGAAVPDLRASSARCPAFALWQA